MRDNLWRGGLLCGLVWSGADGGGAGDYVGGGKDASRRLLRIGGKFEGELASEAVLYQVVSAERGCCRDRFAKSAITARRVFAN